ncbi:hypothetical protein ACFQ48_18520 [Hymenobacter caeli]|uniref:DUF932 domain-containing protein n=1 Tax=Hymenobacter caeli TaxID=2735894 RepID=A0ABX2FX18_9BACT|nr:hypothetical protein [Hymenobacter caeli]NRT20942.1 hypothetical protein [Hymenobacter caeli]
MSQQSISLDRATKWDAICFPVEAVKLADLLPADYQLLPADRQRAIVGEMKEGQKSIFALQSEDYSLVPNALIRRLAEQSFPKHEMNVRFTDRGEFSINLILPDEINIVSKPGHADRLYKTMIINNSYTGKTPFTLQGTALREHTGTRMRVSYYRLICENGLMGWADDYLTLDEYLRWLANGKPKKYKDAKIVKPAEMVENLLVSESEILVQKKFAHKGLNLAWFEEHLLSVFQAFSQQSSSLTVEVYRQMAQVAAPDDAAKVIAEVGLPKMLARTALERLRKEERELETPANLWLAYNAVNYALFNSRSSLTINDRYRLDETAFHHLATLSAS